MHRVSDVLRGLPILPGSKPHTLRTGPAGLPRWVVHVSGGVQRTGKVIDLHRTGTAARVTFETWERGGLYPTLQFEDAWIPLRELRPYRT